jgi:Phage integrase family/Putative transposase
LHRAFLCCAALTGARLGELLGLQWKHIDLHNRKLRIEQSLWHGNLVPPKTAGSVRTIYFGNALAEALNGLRDSKDHAADDFVFSGRDGRPLHPDVLRKDMLYPILDRLRIPRTAGASGFHTFRHSAASILNQETGNLKLAQKLLGHATIDMTAAVYTHTSREAEREAALAIIAQHRFTKITGREVEFLTKDLKEKRVVTTHYLIEEFVDALAAHVPDRYRHAMRRFGLLAPRAQCVTSAALFALLGQKKRPRPQRLSWRNSLHKYFGVDPLVDSRGQSMHWARRLKPVAK